MARARPVWRPTEEQARAELAAAVADVALDTSVEEAADYFVDLLASVALPWPAEVAAEICRTELGWVPRDLRRLRPDVAAIEDGWNHTLL